MRPILRIRSLAIVIALHVLLAIALLHWRPWLPAIPSAGLGIRGGSVPLPRPVPPSAAASTGSASGARKLFEDCAATPDRALVADVYRLPRRTRSVDAMRGLEPVERVCLDRLDVAPRDFREGFPGMPDLVEWFGLDIGFTVKIAEAGSRDLVLLAGDGAILSIDGVDVIDNDGLHPPQPKVARIRLEAGLRHFRVRYFHGPGATMSLLLGWKKADEKAFNYIPRSLMRRPSAT